MPGPQYPQPLPQDQVPTFRHLAIGSKVSVFVGTSARMFRKVGVSGDGRDVWEEFSFDAEPSADEPVICTPAAPL